MDFFIVNASLVVQNIVVFNTVAQANAYAASQGNTAIQRVAQNPSANVGDTVDVNGNRTAQAVAGPKNTILTINQFLNLLTQAELTGIYASANGAVVAVRAMMASEPNGLMSLADPMVIGWINGLVTLALLTAPRGAAILAT